jgi:hypothetical protein
MDYACSVAILDSFHELPDDILHRLTIKAVGIDLQNFQQVLFQELED